VPELPEVETIVREIAPQLAGAKSARAELRKTDVLREVTKPRLIKALQGNTIEQVYRRAKHIVFRLSSGHRMIIQPRMTGSVIVYERKLTRDELKYAVLICTLSDKRKFVYRDVRRLGTIWLLNEEGWIAYTGRIGPEPLEKTFTPFVFADRLRGTRTAVKKAIMDQRRLAGVGNIYANEATKSREIDPQAVARGIRAAARRDCRCVAAGAGFLGHHATRLSHRQRRARPVSVRAARL
jgi:formamidopyrimidine-DNA glycosylase